MKSRLLAQALSLVLFFSASCTHLTAQEQTQWQKLESQGVKETDNQVANPRTAGALNILPGFGNFYLATGKGADRTHLIFGAFNLITWPFSILWGVPEAVIDAEVINKREMVSRHKFGEVEKRKERKKKKAS